MFYENGLEMVKNYHKVIAEFEKWLANAEEVVYCDFYGDSYQEVCAYYDRVKVCYVCWIKLLLRSFVLTINNF